MDIVRLTQFGAAFLLVALLLLGWRRQWLPGLLPVAAVFQAPAVVTVAVGASRFGITPFNVASAFLCFDLMLRLRDVKLTSSPCDQQLKIYRWWTAFLACSAFGAMVLPHAFAGVPVYPLMALSDIDPVPDPNRWSLSHLAQAINSVALWLLFTYVLVEPNRVRMLRIMFAGLLIALLLSLIVGLYQRVAMLDVVPVYREFWGSNPGYNQFFLTPEYGPAIGRVGLPFSEPSYASVWFASAAAGAATVLLYGHEAKRLLVVLFAVAACTGLANTIGTSGIAAFLTFCIVLIAFHLMWGRHESRQRPRAFAWVAGLLAVLIAVLASNHVLWRSDALAPLQEAIEWTGSKFEAYIYGIRFMSDMRAIQIAIDTFGLGAGAGSTRASNYFLSLLGNTGLPGAIILLSAITMQLRAVYRARRFSPTMGWALLGATVCALIGVTGGISDQSWPVLWVLFLACFAYTGAASGLQYGNGQRSA